MVHDVFISHAHKDKEIADALCEKLESAGVRCWIAGRDISATKIGKRHLGTTSAGSRRPDGNMGYNNWFHKITRVRGGLASKCERFELPGASLLTMNGNKFAFT
jgi:hypothetical protein